MFFRAPPPPTPPPPPMYSDDDSYELARRRSRRRSRRRAAPGLLGISKRRASDSSLSARALVVSALFCLLMYELVVLRSPAKNTGPSPSSRAQRTQGQQPIEQPATVVAPPPPPPPPLAVDEKAARMAAALAARARAIEEAAAARDRDAERRRSEELTEDDERTLEQGEQDDDPQPPTERLEAARRAARARRTRPGSDENFWAWFQEGRRNTKVRCPTMNRRLCEMTYKFVHKYKVRTLYDASCARTAEWIGAVLRKMSGEMWGFRYICAFPNQHARHVLRKFPFVSYSQERWWRSGFPPDTEMVLAWDILAHTAYGRVWSFFVSMRRANVKYVLVDNYPGILNDPSPQRSYLNLRKHPFRFPAAKEVVQNVTEPGETANRQLLFYEINMLPDNLG